MKLNNSILKGSSILLLLIITLISCSRKGSELIEHVQLKFKDFEKSGIEHNERLDKIFNVIKASLPKTNGLNGISTLSAYNTQDILAIA